MTAPSKPTTERPSMEALGNDLAFLVQTAPSDRDDIRRERSKAASRLSTLLDEHAALVARTRDLEAALSEEVVDGVETAQRLRTKLASTEAALVGLREAVDDATGECAHCTNGIGPHGEPSRCACANVLACLTSSAALGARVIEEARELGRAAGLKTGWDTRGEADVAVAPASIEAAREEGRAEERAAWAGKPCARKDCAEARGSLHGALAKLSEVEAVCRPLIDETSTVEVTEEHYAALRSLLALPAPAALARVEARVLEEAGDTFRAPGVPNWREMPHYVTGYATGDKDARDHLRYLARKARSRAEKIGGGT